MKMKIYAKIYTENGNIQTIGTQFTGTEARSSTTAPPPPLCLSELILVSLFVA